jgi:hypothetical protein
MTRKITFDGPRELQAALLLAQGRMIQDVAQEVGVTPKTLWEWRRRPEFNHLIAQAHEMLTSRVRGLVARHIEPLVAALLEFSCGERVLTDAQLRTNLALLGLGKQPLSTGKGLASEAAECDAGKRIVVELLDRPPPLPSA